MKSPHPQTVRMTLALLTLASLFIYAMPRASAKLTAAPVKRLERPSASPASGKSRMRVEEAYGKLPLRFEPNRGQTDRAVSFLSRGQGYTLFLTADGARLRLNKPDRSDQAQSSAKKSQREDAKTEQAFLRMKMVGANPAAQASGENELQGRSNYLIGNDRKRWRTDIPTFSRVRYSEVYPGIDAVYYGTNQRQLEYDFILKPGADSRAITLSFEGADRISLDERGDLVLETKTGQVVQRAPVVYQETEAGKQTIAGRYVMKAEGEVGFEVAEYDRSRELVIDPQLLYATFYGGSGQDLANDIAVDASGNAYIAGTTNSADLTIKSAFQGSKPGSSAGFVSYIVKLNADGSDIVYATYLSGNDGSGFINAIALTSDGKACVTGKVGNAGSNSDFPTTSNRFQGNGSNFLDNRGVDAFMTVLTPGGNGLFYSTFFGANGVEEGFGIAVDAANKIYIGGSISGTDNLPTKNAFQNSPGSLEPFAKDAFIAKFDPTLSGNSSLIYSSYLGGGGGEFGNDIAVTPSGVAFIVGVTGSFDYPTKSSTSLPPFQTSQGGVNDSFIAKVSPTGALIYSTYFGGNGKDEARGVAVDSFERAYVTGFTESSAATFKLKNAFDLTREGTNDAYVAKFNADGTALFYSSFLGGSLGDGGNNIAVDAGGNAYITGFTTTDGNFPVISGFASSGPGGTGFITKIEASDATGTTTPKILYSNTFSNPGNGIAVDPRGNVYIAASVLGSFVATPGAFQETFKGGSADAAVIKIGSTFPDTIGVFRPPSLLRSIPFQLRNSNTAGPADLTVDFGQAGDQPLAGDWNGDGIDDMGVYRPSTGQFLLRQVVHLQVGGNIILPVAINFGQAGDKPVVGDWDGDGIDTPGVFRPPTNQWFLTNGPNTANSSPPIDITLAPFGVVGDIPVAGDWNGDGKDGIGVWRPSNGQYFLSNSLTSPPAVDFTLLFGGISGDLPVVGDWNGDGVDTVGVFGVQRGGVTLPNGVGFFLDNSNTVTFNDLVFGFGQPGDIPLAGEWDGLAAPANQPPNSGVNSPSDGSSAVGQTQVFTTTCSDNDGWHNIATIDFKIARSDGTGVGVPIALWAQFDENRNLIRLYDPDLNTWQEGVLGANVVLENGFAQLYLSGTSIQGSGPTGPSVQVTWKVVFKAAARGNNYKQFLKITDDAGLSTGFDKVGSWSISK